MEPLAAPTLDVPEDPDVPDATKLTDSDEPRQTPEHPREKGATVLTRSTDA
jgi:hypothetical protein